MQLLKEDRSSRLSRIAIFGIPDLNRAQFAAAEKATGALALEAEVMEVRVADDFERALEAAITRHVEAGILLSSPLVFGALQQIGELAIAKRLPLICLFVEFPKAGGLISYGPNLAQIFRRCGDYVAKILHGAKPSELPIQRPEKFDLVINLKTAEALGPLRTTYPARDRRRGHRIRERCTAYVALWPRLCGKGLYERHC